jgi:hypothetical protein
MISVLPVSAALPSQRFLGIVVSDGYGNLTIIVSTQRAWNLMTAGAVTASLYCSSQQLVIVDYRAIAGR